MNLSIFGLGYVGAVSAACFSKLGHKVIGVDLDSNKINLINDGKSPIIEQDLDEYMKDGVKNKLIEATKDAEYAVEKSDVSIICVGTPSQINGSIDLSYIYNVVEEIGSLLKRKNTFHSVVIRSTVIPGTIENCVSIIENVSGKKHCKDFGVASNPEFLREGTAIKDFWNPPYTIIGTDSEKSIKVLEELYEDIEGKIYCLKPKESEMIKYANNNFHAVKISFANEIGNICKELSIDGSVVMDIVAKDTKLNLSTYYLKPGFAYGGSCLPKDVRGLNYFARKQDLKTPLLNSLANSNEYQIKRGLEMIYKTNTKKIGFLGFAFKEGTDDLRESPVVTLIETLLGQGYDVRLYDKNVLLSKITGKNKSYLINHIPHIVNILKEKPEDVINESETIVIGNKSDDWNFLLDKEYKNKQIVDLVRIEDKKVSEENYGGICW